MTLRDRVRGYLNQALGELGYSIEPDQLEVSYPRQPEHGDYSTNLVFRLAKERGVAPRELGSQLVERLRALAVQDQDGLVETVDLAGSGFINFRLKDGVAFDNLSAAVTDQKDLYGHSAVGSEHKIVVEHTAVNPNKELHIGHLRNACIGDILARILRMSGATVEVQNLINDMGIQVTSTLLGLRELGFEQGKKERFDEFASRVYVEITKRLEDDLELKQKQQELNQALETAQGEGFAELKEFVARILQLQLQDLAQMNVTYDFLVSESATMEFRLWEEAFKHLQRAKKFVKEETGPHAGAWVVQSGGDDVREDKILVRSNGTVTYTGKDVAYHLWKFGLIDFDFRYQQWPEKLGDRLVYYTDRDGSAIDHLDHPTEIVNVIASEQDYPQQVVKDTLRELGYDRAADNYYHLSYELVALSPKAAQELGMDISDRKPFYHMSGRRGIGISFRQLMEKLVEKIKTTEFDKTAKRSPGVRLATPEEIAVGSLRYYLARFNYTTTVIFDFDEALSLEGDTGPYLQYAHARAAGILYRAGEARPSRSRKVDEVGKIELSDSERELVTRMLRFPEVIEDAAASYDVTILTTYANQLATAFNGFYEKNPVLNAATPELRKQRLALVADFRQVMANVLDTLGISAPEAM